MTDCQSKTGAAHFTAVAIVALVEGLKNLMLITLIEADSCISYGKDKHFNVVVD